MSATRVTPFAAAICVARRSVSRGATVLSELAGSSLRTRSIRVLVVQAENKPGLQAAVIQVVAENTDHAMRRTMFPQELFQTFRADVMQSSSALP